MGIGMNSWLSKRAMVPGLLLVAAAATAQEHPDFTGAWTTYRCNLNPTGATGRVIGQVVLKPESQAAVDAYKSLIEGTNYSPGNACVGYGMPESMMGSGGYPMEIIQRPEQLLVVYELHNESDASLCRKQRRTQRSFFRNAMVIPLRTGKVNASSWK